MMRWLLGLLLLINLMIFLWGNLIQRPAEREPVLAAPGAGTIRLLSELDGTQLAALSAEQGDAEIAAASRPAEPVPLQPVVPEEGPLPAVAEREVVAQEPPPVTEQEPIVAEAVETTPLSPAVIPATPEAAEETEVKIAPVCGRVGGYPKRADAVLIANAIHEKHGFDTDLVEEILETRQGYWAMIPEAETRERALQTAERLKAKGVRDIWIFGKPPHKNAISLGLFGVEKNALQQARRVRALGFNVKVVPKIEKKLTYWVGFTASNEPAALSLVAAEYPVAEVEEQTCH